jgi:hypothetical protein
MEISRSDFLSIDIAKSLVTSGLQASGDFERMEISKYFLTIDVSLFTSRLQDLMFGWKYPEETFSG